MEELKNLNLTLKNQINYDSVKNENYTTDLLQM